MSPGGAVFDSTEELLAKIRLGEDNALELKQVRLRGAKVVGPRRDELADELAAIANTSDGVCVLGIDDATRDVSGIPVASLDAVEALVREVCQDSVTPPLRVRVLRIELPNAAGALAPVLRIDVPRSLFVHRSPGGYLHRVGSSKREMAPELLARVFQQRSQARLIRFDEQAVPDATLDDLDRDLWERLCDPKIEDPIRTLHKRRVLTLHEGHERATVTGVLMCARHPETWLPGANPRAVRFRGVVQDSTKQVDGANISGPLDQQILRLYAFARRNMRIAVRPDPPAVEVPQFSERGLFEAIVNAVVHRDYSIYGSRIRLFIFDDRLEIYSPGPLPNTLSVESMALRQSTRNEALKSIMVKLRVGEAGQGSGRGYFMEAQGDGVPVIVRETRALAHADPVWRVIDDNEVLLTIPSAAL